MAWTTPRTWVPGELVTAGMMNLHVRDNLSILKTSIANDGTLLAPSTAWTPIVTADGGASGQTYTTQSGSYTKFGTIVKARFNVTLSAKGTLTGNVLIGGFPHVSATSSTDFDCCPVAWDNTATAFVAMMLEMQSNTTTAFFRVITAANASIINSALATANINNTTTFRGTMIYRSAA